MRAMIEKEFRQLRRDRRTLALMIVLPVLLLVVFGYAARFDVSDIPTAVVGPGAEQAAAGLREPFVAGVVEPGSDAARAEELLRAGEAPIAVVLADPVRVLVDGSELFTAQSALRQLEALGSPTPAGQVRPEVLFNPDLSTAVVMVPALIGLILLFIGTVITSLGVVRERQEGTLEPLAVMPLRAADIIAGKIAPYFLVAVVDLAVVTTAGLVLFDVPFRGSVSLFAVAALVYLLVVLGIGVLVSTVSRTQGEAIQLSIMVLLPQVLLSGMIFPLESMAAGVRWIGYLLPLTYFTMVVRGVMVRGAGLGPLTLPVAGLVVMAIVVFGLAILRFRRELSPFRHAADLEEAA